ncbi:MAG: ATP-binding cassette domain-containing protein [Planctomycetaceae bacterium]|nr:ATP-binding cassette domain-containing protein [Planctomycetaceae bacterium]
MDRSRRYRLRRVVGETHKGAAVRVRGLVVRYGALTAVDGLDLEVRAGTCMGILGPNGAGKTTTIEVLEGLRDPDAGEVEVLGRTWSKDPQGIRERIGVQLQETDLQRKLTVIETLRMFQSFYREKRDLGEILELVGLTEKRRARVDDLSGGQRQRLTLGCALVNRPELLFLDEPTTGLDPQARRRVWEIVEEFKRAGGTALLTTHYMEEAERLADDLVVVDRGHVVARGTPMELIASLGATGVVRYAPRAGHEAAAAAISEAEFLALPGVRSLRVGNDSRELIVHDTQAAVVSLLGLFEARGIQLEDLSTHRPTLEDVFVALTGKQLRDG